MDVANKLSEGQADILVFTGQELLVYRRALQALKLSGTTLEMATIRYTELTQGQNGRSMATILRPMESHAVPVQVKLVPEVLREPLAAKEAKGRLHLY